MTTRELHQIVGGGGNPAQAACDEPRWFLTDGSQVEVDNPSGVMPSTGPLEWGGLFSPARAGNKVEFYINGQEYFSKVAAAISGATRSVFIAGWQVNYAVELDGGKKLLQCLDEALDKGASVYVMPWLAPPGPIDTGYMHTMLAVYHLNAGRSGAARAYCLPALCQSDMGTLNPFFSHHQKLVVVDNKRAFVGGIDLAYGRREDATYSLRANGRKLEEFYSHCVPAIKELSHQERRDCVKLPELIAAGMTPTPPLRWATTFFTSPPERLAPVWDAAGAAGDWIGEQADRAADAWNSANILPEFMKALSDAQVDAGQAGVEFVWDQLDAALQARIQRLYESGTANAADVGAALVAWLNGANLSHLPASLFEEVTAIIHALVGNLVTVLNTNIGRRPRYQRLFEKVAQMPSGALAPDPAVQPRQPWHDVHCGVEGPSVYDLSMNFVRRWNATAKVYRDNYRMHRINRTARGVMGVLGVDMPDRANVPGIRAEHLPQAPAPGAPRAGSNCVQVLRSAPSALLREEAAAGALQRGTRAQNNCLKAMLKAIHGAQHFLYIEGQFFQTSHLAAGAQEEQRWSGPMASQVSLWRLPSYEAYARQLNIYGKSIDQIDPLTIRWSQVDNIRQKPGGDAFVNDVFKILENWSTIQAVNRLQKPQDALANPIGKALVNRIERAIDDGTPFHVYLVVPVHPEGLLDNLAVMSQVHHTMRSLVHGPYSLVNGVRRALVAMDLHKKGMPIDQAKAQAQAMEVKDLVTQDGSDQWVDYLTLLNLRNWDTIGGRPVTEQIYVHSKLLIADDRVAVLGSANINDRSMLGDRDSELAVIVTDDAPKPVKLDGVNIVEVGESVQALRRGLWETIFGLRGGNRPANELRSSAYLDSPAAPATWQDIQKLAQANAQAYERSFRFVPRNAPHIDVGSLWPTSAIWPTWQYTLTPPPDLRYERQSAGQLRYRMPFDPVFWRVSERNDQEHSWNVVQDTLGRAPESAPEGVRGYITALPVDWTKDENNNSTMSLTVLANVDRDEEQETMLASTPAQQEEETTG